MKFTILCFILLGVQSLQAEEILSLKSAPPSSLDTASTVKIELSNEDLSSPFIIRTDLGFSMMGKLKSQQKNALVDQGCVLSITGAPKAGIYSGQVDSYVVGNYGLANKVATIKLTNGDFISNSIWCYYSGTKAPTLEEIQAELHGKVRFENTRSIAAPVATQVKALEVKKSISMYLGSDQKNLYVWGLNGGIVKDIQNTDEENRCILVSSKVADPKDSLILSGDRFLVSNVSLGYMSTWGKDFTNTGVYLTLERTGDLYELNCSEDKNLGISFQEALQKHFGQTFKVIN